jgi:hypothetical protein
LRIQRSKKSYWPWLFTKCGPTIPLRPFLDAEFGRLTETEPIDPGPRRFSTWFEAFRWSWTLEIWPQATWFNSRDKCESNRFEWSWLYSWRLTNCDGHHRLVRSAIFDVSDTYWASQKRPVSLTKMNCLKRNKNHFSYKQITICFCYEKKYSHAFTNSERHQQEPFPWIS